MGPNDFIDVVARRTGLSTSDAWWITRSVLRSLSEGLGSEGAHALAADLDPSLADALVSTGRPQHLELHDLVHRVQVHTGTTRHLALHWVAAVGMTLGERLHASTLAALRRALPAPVAFLLRPLRQQGAHA